jgi:hypothetical protein
MTRLEWLQKNGIDHDISYCGPGGRTRVYISAAHTEPFARAFYPVDNGELCAPAETEVDPETGGPL